MQKIAIFIPSMEGGGAEKTIALLANQFVEQGVSTDLLLVKKEGVWLSLLDERINLVELKASRVLFSLPKLIGYLRQHPSTTLMATVGNANLVAILAKLFSRSKARVIVRIPSPPSISWQEDQSRRAKLVPSLSKLLYPKADGIIAISKGVAEDLAIHLNMPLENLDIIHNPISLNDIKAKASEPLAHPWFETNDIPVILSVGRLSASKDHASLLRAFKLVHDKRPARLLILGEGPERERLEALAQELDLDLNIDVGLPGFVNNPFQYMAKSSLFVLSSAWEGFGNVLIEALACGCPVVSTDCPGGPVEILDHGKHGLIVPTNDPESLAKAIETTLDQPPSTEQLAEHINNFSVERIAQQYLDALSMMSQS